MRPRTAVSSIVLLAALAWAWIGLDIDIGSVVQAPRHAVRLWQEMWPIEQDAQFWARAWHALIETIQISLLATVIGLLLSIPLGLLAARNLTPRAVHAPSRLAAAAIRVPPSLLWAIIMVLIFGLGPLAGVVAMGLYSTGYLAKLQYEAYEGLPRDALDAVRAMGANRFQTMWHVVIPEAQNALRSQALFMFEYNVRASSIIGVVGAGGIGRLLSTYLSFFEYDRVLAILVLMLATVVVIDALSLVVRRRFLEDAEARRPRWRDVLRGGTPPGGRRPRTGDDRGLP